MAQGDVHLDGDGKVMLDATGKVRLVDAGSDCPDCCGPDCTATTLTVSPACNDVTPAQYIVTFSGVTLCGCVFVSSSYWTFTLNTALNGAHTLDHIGGHVWNKTIVNGLTIKQYGTSDCSGSPNLTVTEDYKITLDSSISGRWNLIVTSVGNSERMFADEQLQDGGANDECATISNTFTNSSVVIGDCGVLGIGRPHTYSGTATVVCV